MRTQPRGRKPIWMTTTRPKYTVGTSYNGEDSGYLAAMQLGWPILDRYGITKALAKYAWQPEHDMSFLDIYKDRVHVWNYVSREFVRVMLAMLCSVY